MTVRLRAWLVDFSDDGGGLGTPWRCSGDSGIEVEHPAEPAVPLHGAATVGGNPGFEQAVVEALVRTLEMVVVDVLTEDTPEVLVAQRDDLR